MYKLCVAFYNIIYNFLTLINTILTDLCSVRNFLVFLTFYLCITTIHLKADSSVIIAALGCFTIILNSYYTNRQKTQELETALNTINGGVPTAEINKATELISTTTNIPKNTSILTHIWSTVKNLFK